MTNSHKFKIALIEILHSQGRRPSIDRVNTWVDRIQEGDMPSEIAEAVKSVCKQFNVEPTRADLIRFLTAR